MNSENLIDKVIRAGDALADEIEVFCTRGRSVSAGIKKGILGTAEESETWSMTIRTIRDGQIGFSSTGDPDRWKECLDAALASGRIATAQEWGGLPAPVGTIGTAPSADPDLIVEIENAASMVEDLLSGAAEHPVDVIGGGVDLGRSHQELANTNGVAYSMERTLAAASLEAIREQSTGYEFDASPFLADISARTVGKAAASLAARSLGGDRVETGRYDVILSPIAAASLIGNILIPALSGRNVKAGRSFLADKLGDQVFDETLKIYDDPFIPGRGSTTWDADGVPTEVLSFVDRGVVERFAYDLRTGYRYGEESTGSAVRAGPGEPGIGIHNLVIDGLRRSDIGYGRAISVHSVVGAHTANPFSGDFSVEISNPFWIEDGETIKPLRTAMLAGNVFEMLRYIEGYGKDDRRIGRLILPSIRLNNQQIIGK